MKKIYAILLALMVSATCYLLAFSDIAKPAPSASVQLIPTNTPALTPEEYIYAVLEDNNALLYCRVVRQPIPPIFGTATTAASISPSPSPTATSTTISLQTIAPIYQTATANAQTTLTVTKTPFPATWTQVPSQETTPIPTIISSPSPITMTVLSASGLNVRQCAAGVNPSTACPVVRVAGSGTYVQATGETYEASTITWRRLTDGNWIAEIINDVRVLGQ